MPFHLPKFNKKGFTLVELMVALAIVAIITAISVISFSDARMKGRDTQRVTDIQQLQMALKNYYYDEGSYPSSLVPGTPLIGPTSGKTYLQKIPTNPSPRTDNGCPDQDYQYLALASSTNFSITFCLGQKNGSLMPGAIIASADNIGNVLPCGSYNVTLNSIGGHACNTGAPDYDTCTYNTVSIGSQCWLAQNLNIGSIVTGTTTQSNNNPTPILEKYCYNNTSSYCQTDGGLYQWDEAMQYSTTTKAQGICPVGWHVPNDAEQNTLDQYLTDNGQTCNAARSGLNDCASAGTKLKTGGSTGFNGLLSGFRNSSGIFLWRTQYGFFWSSSVSGSSAWRRSLSVAAAVDRNILGRDTGFPVRCLQNCAPNCSGKACGDDGCSGSCGTCAGNNTCGGGGTANQCGCTTETDTAFCTRLGYNCGSVTANDNCGNPRTVTCGSCSTGQTCLGNICAGGLMASYDMSPSGSNLPDLSGNNHTGTISGPTTAENGLYFPAANSYVNLGSFNPISGNSLSVAVTFKTFEDQTNAVKRLVTTASGLPVSFTVQPDSTIAAYKGSLIIRSGGVYYGSGPLTLPQGQITTLVGTYDNATIKDYLDGTLATSTNIGSKTIDAVGSNNIYIGDTGVNGSASKSVVYSVMIFNRALTSAEALAYHTDQINKYNTRIAGLCGTSTIAYSGGPFNNDGTLRNQGGYYRVVPIGNQCWLQDNLNTGTIVTGATTQIDNSIMEKYCYSDISSNCQTDGGLYQWDEAMQYSTAESVQGICPTGWHIPTDAEQNTLDQYLKDSGQSCNASRIDTRDCSTAGTKLQIGGTSGFNGILTGYRDTNGTFANRTAYTDFWSSSVTGATTWYRNLHTGESNVGRLNYGRTYGVSVRCLKNCTPNCSGKACGDDGCGGSCGTCSNSDVCGGGGVANQCGFTCGTSLVNISSIGSYTCNSNSPNYDLCAYPTVQIGTQCWLAKNLNLGVITNSATSSPCQSVSGRWSCQVNNSTIEKYCYNNTSANCATDGGMYEWSEAMGFPYNCNNGSDFSSGTSTCGTGTTYTITANPQGICPAGWHVPTDTDYYILESGLATSTCSASRVSTWDCVPAGTKINVGGGSGYEDRTTGYRVSTDGTFNYKGVYSFPWTSSPYSTYLAWRRSLGSNTATYRSNNFDRAFGMSIRCVKN